MMRVLALGIAVGLVGCSSIDRTFGTDWSRADWFDFKVTAPQPLPPGGKVVKLEDGKEAPAKPKATKGERTLRMTGQTAKDAKEASFEAAEAACQEDEDETGLQAEVVKDKAGNANGSYFHDIEFNCVKGEG